MSHLLEVRELTAGYGAVAVLRGINLHVDDGEIVVVLGANGAGKTTMLRALSGMIAGRGSVTLQGKQLLGLRPERIVRLGVSHVPQGRGTITELTVDENLRLGAFARHDREVEADLNRWYDAFPRLAERKSQRAGSMSGGEQQMLAIARALMARPRLLLLDEPSLGLAPLITAEVFESLTEINREYSTAMLVVEQNANLALEVGSRAYVLATGEILKSGDADSLRGDSAVRRAYLGM